MVDPWLAKVWEGRTMPGADEDPIGSAVRRLRRGVDAPPEALETTGAHWTDHQPLEPDWPEPPRQRNDGVTVMLAGVVVLCLVALVVAAALLQDIFR